MIFVKGTKYLVRHKVRGLHRKSRYFVGVYLGIDERTGELQFSLRPESGTSSIHPRTIESYTESVQPCGVKREPRS